MASCCLNNCLIIPPITPLFCTIFPLSQHTPLPIQVTGIETANHIQQEEGIVKTQTGNVRGKGNKDGVQKIDQIQLC